MNNERFTRIAAAPLLPLLFTLCPIVAQAQDSPPPVNAAVDAQLETIVVTGTRSTSLQAAESPAPIQVLSAADLQRASGNPDLIQTLATIVPSLTAQAFGGDMANQTLQAKLRGLSPNHVLVLIDGKRRHTTGNLAVLGGPYQGGAGADLNFIPVSAIDHIEVLTEGAAAQYGTDAIAGVINIILRKKTSGGFVGGSYGGYIDGGGKTGDVAGTVGFKPANGAYFDLTGEVHNHGHSVRSGVDPRVVDPANIDPAQGGTYPSTNMPYASGYPYLNKIQGDASSHSQLATYNAGFQLIDDVSFYSFGTFGNKNAASFENYRVPSKVSYTDPTTGVVSYPFPYGFDPEEAIKETDYAVTAGFKGVVSDWNWDLSSSWGDDKIKVYTLGSANAGLYGDTGASPGDFYDGVFIATQWTSTLDFSRDFNVGLAGPLNVAFGAETRRDTYEIGAGNPASYIDGGAQSYPGFTPTDAGNHARTNYAGYVDLAATPIDRLYVDLAGRYEHYSDFGSTTVGKLTARYDFAPAFAIRGTVSNGFRAPTLAEEYYSTTNVGPTTAFVQLPPNSAAAALLGLGSGLQPEKSTSYSLGFVFRPVSGMTATLDFYQTSLKNRIVGSGTISGTIGGVTVAPAVTNAIIANGNVLDPDVVATGSTGINIFTNGINTRTRGADLAFAFPVDYNWGHVNWTIGGTYNQTSVTSIRSTPTEISTPDFPQALFDQTATSDLTTASPKYVVNFGALWTLDKFSVNLIEKIYGPSSEYETDFGDATGIPTYYKSSISVTPITDLDLGYQATKGLKLDAGAFNLLNRYPPHLNATLLDVYRAADDNSAVSDYPQFSPFGINGGFYYVKATYSF